MDSFLIEIRDILIRTSGLFLLMTYVMAGIVFFFKSDMMLYASYDGKFLLLLLVCVSIWVYGFFRITNLIKKFADNIKLNSYN